MLTVPVELGSRSYEIAITHGDWPGFGLFARRILRDATMALVVCDSNTEKPAHSVAGQLQGTGFETAIAVIPAGEASKSLAQAARLYNELYRVGADRRTPVVAVGGGVIGDLAGFAAATYNRGLPLLMVPTTLLAMVDSSVGGKVGVNHPGGKNLIGAFHQPAGVWIDTVFLVTLPDREFNSGMAEVIKYGVSLDAAFFARLEETADAIRAWNPAVLSEIIARCCELKAAIVRQDEREETGIRAVLNYGHTFAHAFETVGGYGQWLHGEAVAAGMVCAARLAERLTLIDDDLTARQLRLLEAFALPTAPRPEWPIDELIRVMKRDKKATAGRMRFVLPRTIGSAHLVDDVPEQLVREVLLGH